MNKSGTLDTTYHIKRKTKRSLIYRLNRRTHEVIQAIKRYSSAAPSRIIDLGTADGLMLEKIKNSFPSSQCIGIEVSRELPETNTDSTITLLQGDVNHIPLSENTVDIVVATAVIEHVRNAREFLQESKRVLRLHGLIILTSPDPFWERVATRVGHLNENQHFKVMHIKELSGYMRETGYTILEQKKFMVSPVGIPFEFRVEKIIRYIGLNFLFANQLIIGQKAG
jgi:ubiquinone/menaquinone biosynthesis C-methylase UbiE